MNVFGSAPRADFRPGESVIDLLVELMPIKPADLENSCFSILEFLSSILNIPVDFVMSYAAKNSYIAAGTHPTTSSFLLEATTGRLPGKAIWPR